MRLKIIEGTTLATLNTAVNALTYEQYLASFIRFTASGGEAGLFKFYPIRTDVRYYQTLMAGFATSYFTYYITFYNGALTKYTKENNGSISTTSPTITKWLLYYREK